VDSQTGFSTIRLVELLVGIAQVLNHRARLRVVIAAPRRGTTNAMRTGVRTTILLFLASSLTVACGGGDTDLDCADGKCDTPKGPLEQVCKNSRLNAMDERRPHFTPQGIRWSCRDVNGVTAGLASDGTFIDDRGQEYCEYFTMLQTKGIPAVVNDETGSPKFCDAGTPCGGSDVCDETTNTCLTGTTVDSSGFADILGKNTDVNGGLVTPTDPVLKKEQLDWLALNPDQKVGDCVFTSWHQDEELAVNTNETIGNWRLDAMTPNKQEPLFRMTQGVNSNSAAQQLVGDCLVPGKKKITDTFMRGCTNCGTINGGQSCVPFRKSDPSVCTAAMRIAECGCSVTVAGKTKKLDLKNATDVATLKELFIPTERRGFTLGTWDGIGQLPNGCRYVRLGDAASYKIAGISVTDANVDQQIVACDLKASHIMEATAKDPKEACRATYGEDIVVHVRFPTPETATIKCDTTKPKCAGAPWDFPNL
jgi:hypothetical protein